MVTEREQKLVDLVFSIGILTRSTPSLIEMDTYEYVKWVTKQLRECGFDTYSCGSSWGVLNS